MRHHSNNPAVSPCLCLCLFPLTEEREHPGTACRLLVAPFLDLGNPLLDLGTPERKGVTTRERWTPPSTGSGRENEFLPGNQTIFKLSISDQRVHPEQEGEIKLVLPSKGSLWSSKKHLLVQNILEPRVGVFGLLPEWQRLSLDSLSAHSGLQGQSSCSSCPPKSESLQQ